MKTLSRTLAVLGAAAILASCSSMHNMMNSGSSSGESVTLTGANEVPLPAPAWSP